MEKVLIGAGGFAREIRAHIGSHQRVKCFVNDEFYTPNDNDIYPLSKFDPTQHQALIAIGDPQIRSSIVDKLPKNTLYWSFIHPSAQILDINVNIGIGSVICANSILTTNINIGNHSHLNLSTTIGHDVTTGDFFTTAPGAKISGNCNIGDRVYIGTNASVKEKINITDDVVVGLNAGVVRPLIISGTYVGVPAEKIKNKRLK